MGAAYLVLIVSLLPTLLAYQRVKANARERDLDRFEQIARAKQDAVERRLARYADEVISIGGFFAAQESVDVTEWTRFTRSVSVMDRFPGFQALGFMEVVPASQRAAHEAKWRPLHGGTYTIHPPGARATYAPVVLLSPADPTLAGLLGADALVDTTLQPTLDAARDSGTVAFSGPGSLQPSGSRVTGRITLVHPVYFVGRTLDSVPERRAALRGFIFGVLSVPRLVGGIFDSPTDRELQAELFDGQTAAPANLLYREEASTGNAAQFTREIRLRAANRDWLLTLASAPSPEAGQDRRLPPLVLGLGISMNLLLFGIAWSQARSRQEAERLAEDLRLVQERDRLLERATNDAIWDWDIASNLLVWNEAVQAMFRYSADAVTPNLEWWMERLHSEDRRRVWNGREAAVQTGGDFGRTNTASGAAMAPLPTSLTAATSSTTGKAWPCG